MRDCLAVSVYHSDQGDAEFGTSKERFFHFNGSSLLQLVQEAVNTLETGSKGFSLINAYASEGNPLKLERFSDWPNTWAALRRGGQSARESNSYFLIGGRTIQRIRAGQGGFADGFYMMDKAYSGASRDPVWAKDTGASYKDFAQFFVNNGGMKIEQSEAITEELRKVLSGSADFSKSSRGQVTSALPMLAAAMFIAEPARNPRAFVIGLMLLDMVGRVYNSDLDQGTKFYTLDKMFAHPERLGVNTGKVQPGPQVTTSYDPRKRKNVDRVTDPYAASTTDVVYVEGKYSASPKLSSKTTQSVDLAHDYIQKKELSILVRWLAWQLNKDVSNGCLFGALRFDDANRGADSNDPAVTNDPIAKSARELVKIQMKALLGERTNSFKKM